MMPDTHVSLPYIYHQSPVYTLPCLSRPGGPPGRAEPRYKFVEEIITETTREIEMSEFEETGSEDTEAEKDQQVCSKREKGGSEEENDNKDNGEEEGEQVPDSEQNQVASGVNLVLLSESLDHEENEPHQRVAENAEANEAAVTMVTPAEDKPLKETDLKKADSEKEGFISAQMNKPDDETFSKVSQGPDTTAELGTIQVQDEVRASETAEKTADFTEETESTLSVKTDQISEKAQVSSSATSKRKEKERSHADTKGISKSDAVQTEDTVAKGVQEGSNKNQDEASFKSDVKSLPEAADQKPDGGNETRDQTTDNSEIIALHLGTAKSSQAQVSELSEGSERITDLQEKNEKVDSSQAEKK